MTIGHLPKDLEHILQLLTFGKIIDIFPALMKNYPNFTVLS